jgi:1,4-dihydroxy-2-naphthoate octaprenyltransferase
MEKQKQDINRHIHSKNNIWAALLVSLSGTLAVMFNLHSTLQWIFFALGILFSIGLFAAYKSRSKYIDYLIKKMEGENEHS